ncbi:kinase-like protein [Thelephora ganbajun]|uniref:Kinase-like protein n=1 Tax=Thelephora ganbajun TaxID=370292 RepID=A0ACB6ZG00_THEGA|nr:kinase-like protein [Thelephora ganbajun]
MTLPSSYNVLLSGDLARVGDHPVANGGFADVWEGTHGGRRVCIKHLRISMKNRQTVTKSFFREAVIWKRLRHPNVVPFISVTRNPLQFVSEWMPNGTLTEYVNANPDVNRIGLLLDVAEGLGYLHANYTVHGDLKGPNILVDHNGHARLTDFGLASVVRGLNSILVTQVQGYSVRWAAPEVLEKGDKNTREADIFAFGMVVIEAFTGKYPFSDFNTLAIVPKIVDGERPPRPQEAQGLGLTDSVWDMILRCWRKDPDHRPTMTEVVGLLRECYKLWVANPYLSTLPPWQSTENLGDAKNHAPTTPMPTDMEPTSTQSSRTSRHYGQPSIQNHEISRDQILTSDVPRPGVSQSSPTSSFHELFFDEPRVLSDTAHDNNHHTASKSCVHRVITETAFKLAEKRINKIAEELADGNPWSKAESIIKLRRLCGRLRTVPTSYELGGIVKGGDYPQHDSQVVEIWKGRYNDEAVALKILRVPQGSPYIQKIKRRFCKEVVLMKQLEHDNILPFYGISLTISDLCLVFAWYENGTIMDYLEKKPDVNRFSLLLDATKGLRFLHENHLVHGTLRPSHILIDDNGAARLVPSGCSSIAAVPGTLDMPTNTRTYDHRYSAPELLWPKDLGMDKILTTKESDVYGMGMVAYEVLTGSVPYSECNDAALEFKLTVGEAPRRPSSGITDPIWEFLKKCWSRNPTKRPPIIEVHDAFSLFRNPRRARVPLRKKLTKVVLPGKLKLQVHSVKISLNNPKQQQFSVKFKYGKKDFTTSLARPMSGLDEHTWNDPEGWFIETDKTVYQQLVLLEVLLRTPVVFKRDKLQAPESTVPAVLRVSLIEM